MGSGRSAPDREFVNNIISKLIPFLAVLLACLCYVAENLIPCFVAVRGFPSHRSVVALAQRTTGYAGEGKKL